MSSESGYVTCGFEGTVELVSHSTDLLLASIKMEVRSGSVLCETTVDCVDCMGPPLGSRHVVSEDRWSLIRGQTT